MSKKDLAACYRHINNGGVEFKIEKIQDDEDYPATIRLHTECNSFGHYVNSSAPLDATVAKWLIKSLTDLMPELEKATNISDDDSFEDDED